MREKETENLIFGDKIRVAGGLLRLQRIGETDSRLSGDITITSLDTRKSRARARLGLHRYSRNCVLSMTSNNQTNFIIDPYLVSL